MFRLRHLICIASLALPATAVAQTRAFIVRLGTDTIAIERFTRTGNTVVGEVVRHVPATSVIKYTLVLNADGTPASYEEGAYAADGSPLPPSPQGFAQTGMRMRFDGDSVERAFVRNGEVVATRIFAPRGTIPALGGTSPYWQELAIQAARRTGQKEFRFIGFAPNQDAPASGEVRFVGKDSAEIWLSGFPRAYKLDAHGRILRGDGARSTLKQVITPLASVDIAAIASSWAARDARGLALGNPSTRDTVTAKVGDANIWIDYGRPAKRGRVIWGQLVPFDTVWRFGANAAAQLRTDKDLEIGNAAVPAGTYTLWLLPRAGQSFLIVNRQTGQWGTVYDPAKDLVRIPVAKHRVTGAREERFHVSIVDGHLLMLWDDAGYDVAIAAAGMQAPSSHGAPTDASDAARADSAFQHQAWKIAADLYTSIAKNEPSNGMAWFRLGVSREQLGRGGEAVDAYGHASQLNFQRPMAEMRMARLLAEQGNSSGALEHLRKLAAFGPAPAMLDNEPAFASLRATSEYAAIHKIAEDARYPCRGEHTFDFWVGEFETGPWNQPNAPAAGRLHNTREYEGCVIVERWSSGDGLAAGMSMAFYDVNRKAWRMIWNDDANSSNDFEGSYHDGAMRFEGWVLDANGNKMLARNVLQDVTPDLIRHIYSTSSDSGKTWVVRSDGRFVRRKP